MNKNKVVIVNDPDSEMLSIEVNGECVFYGNYWDFTRPADILELLKSLVGLDVIIEERPYEEWE